jgi:transcriptional antiterminator NusG
LPEDEGSSRPPGTPWHVLWTRSHCEQLVNDHLKRQGFHPYIPEIDFWSGKRGFRRLSRGPMFSGYLFLNDALDKRAHVEVRKARGLVRILGEGWDRPAIVPEGEVAAIRKVADCGLPISPFPYLREGQRVRITEGPLQDVEGHLLADRRHKGLFVLSVDLLQRSVSVQVDCTRVAPA